MNSNLLPLAVFIPLFAGVILLAGRRLPSGFAKGLATFAFLFPAVAAVLLWSGFDATAGKDGFNYVSELPVGIPAFGISLKLGLSGLSAPLFAMAAIVGLAAGIQAMSTQVERENKYLGLILFMLSGLLGLFASMDAIFFYFFHEFALIPTFILMLGWGGHGRRSTALFMAVYLTAGAMLSLVGLISLHVTTGAQSFDIIALRDAAAGLDAGAQSKLFGFLLFGFGILVSLFPFHSWAPEGYSTAPSPVSMLHAGVLKKFGLFGLIQIGAFILPEGLKAWAPWMIGLGLGNVVLLGAVTMVQRDLKLLVSWSSVAHMGACFIGIAAYASGAVTGLGGVVMMMFAHGLSVALLFVLTQAVYKRTGTFAIGDMGGLATKAPVLAGFFVAATMASIGLPGFANFWGELTIFASLAKHVETCPWILVGAISGIIISAIYGLRAASGVFFGPEGETVKDKGVADIAPAERATAGLLLLALVAVGVFPALLAGPVNAALSHFKSTAPVRVEIAAPGAKVGYLPETTVHTEIAVSLVPPSVTTTTSR